MMGIEPPVFSRFTGSRGDALTIEALKDQKIILGNAEAADELRSRGQLKCFLPGESLVQECDWGNDITFILAGKVSIKIAGFGVAERKAGQHIGEMALIDPSQPRSASAVAIEPTIGLVVSELDFAAVAAHHPDMWRQIAKEIADRLRQRNKFIRPSNAVPRVFIACASEALVVADAIKAYFREKDVNVEIWTDGVFKPSKGTMESLEERLSVVDFAVAIFSADDLIRSRGRNQMGPRDNTIFELGMFAGAIGRSRSFFAVQADVQIKIPTDLAGITSLRYSMTAEKIDVEQAGSQIEERISSLGPR